MIRAIYKLIFFRLLGWRIEGDVPNIDKYVVVVAPHTSNFDFMIGVFTRRILQFDPKYVAKKELFVWPLGYFFKWMGGYPVDREGNKNFVRAIADEYNKNEKFIVTMTPEGTRSYNPDWKTGFYHLSKMVNIPIVRVGFDYGKKRVVIDKAYFPGDDLDECINDCKKYFSQFAGKNKENGVKWEE